MQCQRNENIKDIFKRYANRINKDINNIYFLNNGNRLNNNIELEKINHKYNKIIIFVFDICKNNNNEKANQKELKDIICPECGENCVIEIKDYKINLNKCDNQHELNNILLEVFNSIQIINVIKKSKCNICNKNKLEIYDNKIYKCCNCNTNLCSLCKSNHNKEHIIIDYDLINYICKLHGERYTSYCKQCEKNICDICELEHNKNHNLIYHRDIVKNKENNNLNELKIKIDKLKHEVNDIISKLNTIINNLDIYYNINNIINNSNNNIRNRNFQILININNIYKSNNIIINDINNIINENSINYKIKYLYEMYNKMIDKNSNICKKYEFGNYFGELRNEKREGIGRMYYNNGDKYEGEWKDDKIEGKGIYIFKDYNRYEGDFKASKREGRGIFFYTNGNKYEGEWKNDNREGRGIMYYYNGIKYEGDWKNNIREGKGILYYKDGNIYEGEFKNDKKEGRGIYYYNNGNREMGNYLKGEKIGKHVTLNLDGHVHSKYYYC